MSTIIARCYPTGLAGLPYTDVIRTSSENDIPTVEHVGEAVHQAVENAWKDGHNPCGKNFMVVVLFSST